ADVASRCLPTASITARGSSAPRRSRPAAIQSDHARAASRTSTVHHHPTTAASPDRPAGRERRTTDRRKDLPPTALVRSQPARQSPCACRSRRTRSRCVLQRESQSSRTQLSDEALEQLARPLATETKALPPPEIELDALIDSASNRPCGRGYFLPDLHRHECRAALEHTLLL